MTAQAPSGERLRLFVAADLPAETLRAAEEWQQSALSGHEDVRATDSLHITLTFLGDLPRRLVPEIVAELGGVQFPPLQIAVEEALFLPARGKKRVVALGLDDESGELRRLQAEVTARLARHGLVDSPLGRGCRT